MLQQLQHRKDIIRQLGKSMYGKIVVFDDGDTAMVLGLLSSGRLVVILGKECMSFDLSRIKYVKQ